MAKVLTQEVVEQWLKFVDGTFQIKDIWAELGIQEPANKSHLRVILFRIEQEGKIAKLSRDGTYRKISNEARPMDWQSADPKNIVPLLLPFDIHDACKIYRKSIIIVAGSVNEGKTAFLYETIKLNMNKFTVDLFNSETGVEQMRERFEPLKIPEPAPFAVYERYDNFADVVHPEHLTVIDYLDLNSEVYLVGAEIDAIFRKLTNGVAIIGLQKPPPSVIFSKTGKKTIIDRDLAYGGGFTAKRATLYITMGSHKLKLFKVKIPKDPKVNPKNMMWTYSFDGNGYFTDIQRFYGAELEP